MDRVVRWYRSARRHRVGKAHAMHVITTTRPIPVPATGIARELTAAIGAFIDHWNEHPVPFAWTKDADTILGKIKARRLKPAVLQTASSGNVNNFSTHK